MVSFSRQNRRCFMKQQQFLKNNFTSQTVNIILKEKNVLLKKMLREQKKRLTKNQYKISKQGILERIAFFKILSQYLDENEALKLTKEYYYAKAKIKIIILLVEFLGKNDIGCNLFQKLFAFGLRKDTWISKITQNNSKAFTFDITKCLYKDLCDYYQCPKCCILFCDGDWLLFGNMKKMRFERQYTLGCGDSLCDFHFFRKNSF